MTTIRDVARKAGVAPITVSRVLNNSGYASHDTRQRVEAAIAELGYVPNQLSQNLRFKRSNTLALILSDIINPFWMPVARGVEDACSTHGLNVILCNTDENPEKLADHVDVLLRRQADGFIVVPVGGDAETIRKIQKQNVPLVLLDRRVPGVEVDVIRSDSEGGAYRLTRYLIGLGHRRIAIIGGPETLSTSWERVNGYRRALDEAALPIDDDLILYGVYNQENGYTAVPKLLNLENRPTAIFGGNNLITIGAMQALYERGFDVPQDFSVASFDDLPESLLMKPFLTTVKQQGYAMGYQAGKLLIEQINGQAVAGNRDVILPVDFVEHDSCRALL